MKYNVFVNGNKYEVVVEEESEVAVSESEKKESVKDNKNVTSEGELIKAPMPGKIIDIKVSLGDTIHKNDVLFVLEAMKMENEIMSPKDGVVTGLFIEKNANVNVGDKLISIK